MSNSERGWFAHYLLIVALLFATFIQNASNHQTESGHVGAAVANAIDPAALGDWPDSVDDDVIEPECALPDKVKTDDPEMWRQWTVRGKALANYLGNENCAVAGTDELISY